MRTILSISLALLVALAQGQDKVLLDSLETVLGQAKNDTSRVAIQLLLVNAHLKTDFRKSLGYAHTANELALHANSDKYIAKSYHSLATVLFGMSDYKNAAANYFNALRYYENQRDTVGIIAMNVNLGAVHDRLYDFEAALEFYLHAQDLILSRKIRSSKIDAVLPSLYNNIGNIYQTKGEPKNALTYYEKALALAGSTGSEGVKGIAYNNLGKLYLNELNDRPRAIEFLQAGLAIRKAAGDKSEMSKSYVLIADYFLKENQIDSARASALMAIRLGQEVGSLAAQKFATETLSKIEEAAGRSKEALEGFKRFKAFSDSIQNQDAATEMTRLKLQYDFEKAEQAREQEKAATRFRYTLVIVVLATGLVVAILVGIVIRSRAKQLELKRQNLAQDMEIKNKELTTNVLYLIRKNELINSVAERLLGLQHSFPPENQKAIHEIILDLQKEADSDAWTEFELRFNQVHSDFYLKLRALYPGLSPSEEKLCAFLRLNMSSKEIAAITHQSVKSVEVSRARLRKKLNLTNTSSNLVTHLSAI